MPTDIKILQDLPEFHVKVKSRVYFNSQCMSFIYVADCLFVLLFPFEGLLRETKINVLLFFSTNVHLTS